jgi:diketogulonate reductase-like aldo/keto reductase
MSRSVASMPAIMYGTAWKKGRTKELVEQAVRSGFRGIDTACQPKHYHEKGVGDALASLYASNAVSRGDLFLQTKFTALGGQDKATVPYNPIAPLREQILESFQISLTNLGTEYLDSLVLHSPMAGIGDTLTAWRAFEEIHARGQQGGALRLGLSNTYDLRVLRTVYEAAAVKPTVLQNRFYRESGYDTEIRAFCTANNITYQSFWTLTGNPDILKR